MKKSIFLFFIICGALVSCSNDSKEYELAAKELCSCMIEGEVQTDDAAAENMNLGLCLLGAEVDLKAPEMSDEIEKQCPEFQDGFEGFVKEMK
ncbi:MAG: hypothetical protein P8P74_11610 [Crocinitomicaceae bacterium]|nr:hypothetical protein [Crocinitomicaceae bacterium]